jgi:hypothetical protein
MRPARQRPAEEAGQLTAEEIVEARAGARLLGPDQALECGTVFEKTWCSASVPGPGATCGVHVGVIGSVPARFDPWREGTESRSRERGAEAPLESGSRPGYVVVSRLLGSWISTRSVPTSPAGTASRPRTVVAVPAGVVVTPRS